MEKRRERYEEAKRLEREAADRAAQAAREEEEAKRLRRQRRAERKKEAAARLKAEEDASLEARNLAHQTSVKETEALATSRISRRTPISESRRDTLTSRRNSIFGGLFSRSSTELPHTGSRQ